MKPLHFSFQLAAPKDAVQKDAVLFKATEEPIPISPPLTKVIKSDIKPIQLAIPSNSQSEASSILDALAKEKKQIRVCALCKRKFKNDPHLKLHLEKSKLHKQREQKKVGPIHAGHALHSYI